MFTSILPVESPFYQWNLHFTNEMVNLQSKDRAEYNI